MPRGRTHGAVAEAGCPVAPLAVAFVSKRNLGGSFMTRKSLKDSGGIEDVHSGSTFRTSIAFAKIVNAVASQASWLPLRFSLAPLKRTLKVEQLFVRKHY